MGIFRGTGGTGDSTTDTTVTTVTEKAAEAASSATSAANSATSAANSASSASTSKTNAATSESNAATSASNASTSETNAATSASQAATSATNSASSATASASSASSASTSATNAATSATAAQTAETNAETAETNAETAYANTLAIFGDATDVQNAVNDAEKLAINPEDSQYTLSDGATTGYSALHHAAKAEDHKTAAEVSKNAAETAETAAETAQGLAETAKTAAETAQSAAETAQAAAELAQSNAETVYDDFDDRYLGTKSGDPLVDNDNEGLTTGTLYFNTTENEMRVYTGTAWVAVVDLAGDITVNSLTSNNDVVVKGNLEVQGTTITVDSATAQTIDLGDNDKIRFGDSDDLQIYHDGTDSYIANTTGTLKLSGNTDVTGNITVSGTVDGRDIATDGATLDAVASTYVDVSGDTMTGDLAFGDNVKAKFGASDDLQIFHNGSNSYIREVGTGNLVINANDFKLKNAVDSEFMIDARQDGAVYLYHNGSQKLATTSSGVDITGTVVADGLTVDGAGTTRLSVTNTTTGVTGLFGVDSNGLSIASTNASQLSIGLGGPRLKVENSGDISFYDDAGTSQDFYWDASTSRLGIGTTSPGYNLEVRDSSNPTVAIIKSGVGGLYLDTNSSGSDATMTITASSGLSGQADLAFKTGGNTPSEAMRITSGGDVYIGDSSPGFYPGKLDVTGTITARVASSGLNTNFNVRDADEDDLFSIYTDGTTGEARLRSHSDSPTSPFMTFYTGSSEAMRIDSSGRVGIGTTSPLAALHIVKSNTGLEVDLNNVVANGVRLLAFDRNASTDRNIQYRAAQHFFNIGSSEAMRIDSNGRLGIGTTSPSSDIHIAKSSSVIRMEDTDNNSYGMIVYNTASGGLLLRSDHNQLTGTSGSNIIFQTDGSEAMRIDSSGNVGIGTTSPSEILHIQDGSSSGSFASNRQLIIEANGQAGIQISSTSTSGIEFGDTASATSGRILYQHDVDAMRLYTAGSEAMRIDSSGNVGIGTTSPSATLDLTSSTNGHGLKIRQGNAGSGYHSAINFEGSNGSGGYVSVASIKAYQETNGANGSLRFYTNTTGSEAARIDSSGNLLVGKTATSYSTEGVNLTAGGHVTRSGDTVFAFNRTSSDGSIVNFAKDGTTVGSIGSAFGNRLTIGDGDTGLRFAGDLNQIAPWNTSTNNIVDNSIDLGEGINRFKDLYLSGGVYLGGTGDLNKLEDYEEGTFTANLRCGGTTLLSSTACKYTKIGIFVFYTIDFASSTYSGVGANTGNVDISGLPFTSSGNGRTINGSPSQSGGVFTVNLNTIQTSIVNSTSILSCHKNNATGISNVTEVDLSSSSSSSTFLRVSGFYQTF